MEPIVGDSRPYWPKHVPMRYDPGACECRACLDYARVNSVSEAWELAIQEDAEREVEEFLNVGV